jgi:YVTN family beta-propeller protein
VQRSTPVADDADRLPRKELPLMRSFVHRSLSLSSTLAFLALGACGSEKATPEEPIETVLPPGARVVYESDKVEVNQGKSRQISARVVDAAGNTLSNIPLTFRALGTAPLSVSSGGMLTGVRPGAGVVEVKAGGSPVDTLDVDVFGRPEGLIEGTATLGLRPFGVAVSREGVVYVTQLDAGTMSVTDVRSRSITGSVPVGSIPTGVTFAADGLTAYVTNQGSGNVGIVNVATGQQVGTIDVPGDPFVVRVAPQGGKLYVASNANVVSIVDLASSTVTEQIPVGSAPNGFAVSRDEQHIYVSSAYGNEVTEISTATDQVTRRFTVNGIPQELIVSKDGTELYSANEAGWVDVIDLETGTVVAHITLAGGGFGMALSPDEVHLYVSVPNEGVVQVVNTQSRNITHTIAVEGHPRRIAFDYHGGRAVVANEAGKVNFVR